MAPSERTRRDAPWRDRSGADSRKLYDSCGQNCPLSRRPLTLTSGSLALLLTQSCGSFPGLQIGRSRLLREEPEQTSLALWSLQKGFQESPAVKVAKNVGFIEWPLQ
jgi:hypothetical protein